MKLFQKHGLLVRSVPDQGLSGELCLKIRNEDSAMYLNIFTFKI